MMSDSSKCSLSFPGKPPSLVPFESGTMMARLKPSMRGDPACKESRRYKTAAPIFLEAAIVSLLNRGSTNNINKDNNVGTKKGSSPAKTLSETKDCYTHEQAR